MFELCEESKDIPNSDEWIYELKFDGERVRAIKKGERVELWNRNRKTNQLQFEKSLQYPEIIEDLMLQIHDFTIDGELSCADLSKGLNEFNKRALSQDKFKIKFLVEQIPIKFRVFDVLEVDGVDVTKEKLIIRKTILNSFIDETDNIEIVRYCFDGKELWNEVLKNGYEGMIAKRKNSVYVPKRTFDWLKIKFQKELIVNIEGFKETSGQGSYGGLITDRCDVAIRTLQQLKEYLNIKPTKARLRCYGQYPSGKLRNPVLMEMIR